VRLPARVAVLRRLNATAGTDRPQSLNGRGVLRTTALVRRGHEPRQACLWHRNLSC
jgi:hypothetical protein